MSLWSRLKRRVSSFVGRLTGPEPFPLPERQTRGRRGRTREPEPSREGSQLPSGWSIVGLYHDGEQTQRIHATNDTEATDSDIQDADAIIVWYEDAGGDGYRWIHGATGWDSLADQIERVVTVVSPAGRGE